MTRFFCFFLGHALIRQRQTVDGIPGILGFTCGRCGHWEPALNRTHAEHASVKAEGDVLSWRLVSNDTARTPKVKATIEIPAKRADVTPFRKVAR